MARSLMSRRRRVLAVAAGVIGGLLLATVHPAAGNAAAVAQKDTSEMAPVATQDAKVPGATPVRPAGSPAALAATAAAGTTTTYVDQSGVRTYRIDDGFDLDQYLYAPSSPLDASLTLDSFAGPTFADGSPAPGNIYYARSGRLTLRAFDVDDDYTGTDVARELDQVVVNGHPLDGYLSGTDGQWSTATFELPLMYLRFPTTPEATTTNDVQVRIDTGNGGATVWAVQVDWMELRLVDSTLPALMVHGITSSGAAMEPLKQFYESHAPDLQAKIANPSVTRHGSIAENARMLEGPGGELLAATGASQLNVVAHSMGGLDSRLYAWDHPGTVRNLMMIATPNGGSRLADIMCVNRNIPWWVSGLAEDALNYFTRQFGPCDSPDDGLWELQQNYVQDVFDKQVLDSHNVRYYTIAGQGNAGANLLLDGEDDGAVSVDSVRYLRPDSAFNPNPDHPGLHSPLYPAYERSHSELIDEGSEALPRSMCTIYPLLYRCDSSLYTDQGPMFLTGAPTAAPAVPELAATGSVHVPAHASAQTELAIESTTKATVAALTGVSGVTGTLGGVPMSASAVFSSPALLGSLSAGGVVTVSLTNGTSEPVDVPLLATVATDRHLTLAGPSSLTMPGRAAAFRVTMTHTLPGDEVHYQVRDGKGGVVASGLASAGGDGSWTFGASAPTGQYGVSAWTEGPSARSAQLVWSVGSSTDRIEPGSLTDGPVDRTGDGLADVLSLGVGVTVDQPGDYRVSVRLRDAAGREVATAGTTASLGAGSSAVTVEVPGHDLFAAGSDGPWTVTDVTLADAGSMRLLDERALLGTTAGYSYRSFTHFPVEFDQASFTDTGVDADGDKLFEALAVSGRVQVDEAGTYAVNARLVDAAGHQLAEYATVVSMAAGANPLSLVFAGEPIGRSGADGPYRVQDLSVYSLSYPDALGFLTTAHLTESYDSDQFVGGVLTFAGVRAMITQAAVAGTLDPGASQSLLAKLDAAEQSVARGRTNAADNQLAALSNELAALPGTHVSDSTRSKILAAVARLRIPR